MNLSHAQSVSMIARAALVAIVFLSGPARSVGAVTGVILVDLAALSLNQIAQMIG
jgi:hypothetical protein